MAERPGLWDYIFGGLLSRIEAAVFLALILTALMAIWFTPAEAQTVRKNLVMQRSTPDISISATATVEVADFTPGVAWVSIKNDCADDIYFDLRGEAAVGTIAFPVLLKQAEVFTFEGSVHMIQASHGVASTEACTITLIPAR